MIKNKIYDGNSFDVLEKSFVSAFAEMSTKNRIMDATVANGGTYIECQLREVVPGILKQVYPDMPFLNFMSVNNSGALAQSIVQRVEGFAGRHYAKHESSNTSGAITINRAAREQLVVEYEGNSIYSDTDLRRSILLGEGIDTSLIEAHNFSFMTMVDEIGFLGATLPGGERISDGIANYQSFIADLKLTATSPFVMATAGLVMYNDVARLYNKIVGLSGASEQLRPKIIVLPVEQFSVLSTALMTGTSPVTGFLTVREFLETNLKVKIYASNRLKGQGTGGTDRLVMFNNDSRNMQFYLPQPLQFAPVQLEGFHYKLFSKFRMAGMGFNRSNAIGYLDGI